MIGGGGRRGRRERERNKWTDPEPDPGHPLLVFWVTPWAVEHDSTYPTPHWGLQT